MIYFDNAATTFPKPEECPLHKMLRTMEVKPFSEGSFTGLREFGEVN